MWSGTELAIAAAAAVLLFGGGAKLKEFARGLGAAKKEFAIGQAEADAEAERIRAEALSRAEAARAQAGVDATMPEATGLGGTIPAPIPGSGTTPVGTGVEGTD